MSLYYISVYLHVLAALLWLGGIFFLAAVAGPILRKLEPEALRARLFSLLGRRFRYVGWIAIAVLLVTGAANLHFRGLLRWQVLGNREFWAEPFGYALAWKLVTVALMLALSAIHDFALGPMASRAPSDSERALALRRQASWIARLNVLVGLALVIAAARLARGG